MLLIDILSSSLQKYPLSTLYSPKIQGGTLLYFSTIRFLTRRVPVCLCCWDHSSRCTISQSIMVVRSPSGVVVVTGVDRCWCGVDTHSTSLDFHVADTDFIAAAQLCLFTLQDDGVCCCCCCCCWVGVVGQYTYSMYTP